MDADMARIVTAAAIRAGRELGDMVPMLAEYFPEDAALRLGLATAIAEIGLKVLNPIYEAFPEVEAEFQARLDKHERAI